MPSSSDTKASTSQAAQAEGRNVICVDLDGTLLRTDLLYESFVDFLLREPAGAWRVPSLLRQGKSRLKEFLAEQYVTDWEAMPWRTELVALLREARQGGAYLVLATASNTLLASQVAAHLGLFDEVIASSATNNMKGPLKRAALVERFGAGGFIYVGDHTADIPVWQAARSAWVVGSERFAAKVRRSNIAVERTIADPRNYRKAFMRALRPYQWVKNILVFLPMLLAHHFWDAHRWGEAILAFSCFSLLASTGYLINDIFDRRSDRLHARKRTRPFASGELSLKWALGVPVLLLAGLGLGAWLSLACLLTGLVYFVSSVGYSLVLKNRPVIDVMTLSLLYSARLIMGGFATKTMISVWLIDFSIFFFLGLALVKRTAELRSSEGAAHSKVPGRGYIQGDRQIVQAFGVCASYLSATVLAMYIQSPEMSRLYRHPTFLWPVLPLLLTWISHIWLLTNRGQMTDDPIVFAFRDNTSRLVGLLIGITVLLGV